MNSLRWSCTENILVCRSVCLEGAWSLMFLPGSHSLREVGAGRHSNSQSKSAFLPVIETACHLSVLRKEVFALKKKRKETLKS